MRSSLQVAAVLAVLLGAAMARAVPAPPFAIPLKNADGSVVMGRMFGDERLSWVEDAAGGWTLAFDRASGDWRYALKAADGRLVPSALRVGHGDPRALGVEPHLTPSLKVKRLALASRPQRRDPVPPAPRAVKNLVLLVKFANQETTYTKADFEPVFNGATASVHDFYQEISYGQFDLTSTITDWIPLPNDDSYYAYNDIAYGHPEEMLWDAVAWLDAHNFDFSPYDVNGDGIIDAVDIIHSGPGYETTGDPNYIHSHFSPMGDDPGLPHSPVTASGLVFPGYHTEPEFRADGYTITQIGVICHETAHFFGAPDLYDYNYASSGLGMWSLMAMGPWGGPNMDGTRPTHPDAWSRYVLGFGSPVPLSADAAGLRLTPSEVSPNFYRVDSDMPSGQYFLLEDRQKVGYDLSLPGSGLLLFHVDEMEISENDPSDYLVDLEQADGRSDLNRSPSAMGDTGDPFPGSTNNTRFTPMSVPSSVAYGRTTSRVWVTNIARAGSDVTFDLAFRDPKLVGEACAEAGECASGFCVGALCCDAACDDPLGCSACALALGATRDGHCTPLTGPSCDDDDPCTVGDACVKGACTGTAMACPGDLCHQDGKCNRLTGVCENASRPDGTPCDDGSACTQTDVCHAGFCLGGNRVVCHPADACHVAGICEPTTGTCSDPVASDGVSCGENMACASGTCKTLPPKPPVQPDPTKPNGSHCSAAGGSALSPLSLLALWALVRRRRPA